VSGSGISEVCVAGILGQAAAIAVLFIDYGPDGTSVCAPEELGAASPIAFEDKHGIWIFRIDQDVTNRAAGRRCNDVLPDVVSASSV
jgi:hypothetical protein